MKKKLLLIASIVFIAFNSNAQFFSDDFQSENIDAWTTVTPTYNSYITKWHLGDYNADFYLSASCFNGSNNETNQWIISPSFDATGVGTISVTFDNRVRYAPYNDLEVYVSTDFAGDSASFDAATWIPVTGFTLDADPDNYDWELATTGTAPISGSANTYVAFHYTSTTTNGGNWLVNNVVVSGPTSVGYLTSNTKLFPNPATSY